MQSRAPSSSQQKTFFGTSTWVHKKSEKKNWDLVGVSRFDDLNLWKCHEGAIVQGSGQWTVTRQQDPNFFFSLFLCIQVEVQKTVFLLLGRAWHTILHKLQMY